jgi:hypothetical protein
MVNDVSHDSPFAEIGPIRTANANTEAVVMQIQIWLCRARENCLQ